MADPEQQPWQGNLKSLLMPARGLALSTDYTYRNQVRLVKGGYEYFEVLVDMINRATRTIHLQTYIYEDDITGRHVTNSLKEAAARGVQVFMLVDAYASRALGTEFAAEMQKAGIRFRTFEPFFRRRNFYFGRRLHHKIVVCDERYSLVGGVNISDRYNDLPDEPAWLDWALFSEGEVSFELYKVCLEMWFRSYKKAKAVLEATAVPQFPLNWNCAVKIRRTDWVRQHNQVSRSYIEMFNRAEHHLIMMASYFLPGRVIRRNLKNAAKRGVEVSLILAAISDVPMSKYAERYIYRWMIRNNIRIYEYPRCVLHAKLSTYDARWVTIGSYNVNNISAYASVELNLDVQDDQFASQVDLRLQRIMETECQPITMDQLSRYNLLQKFLQWWSYEVYRFVVYIFTFYFRQRERRSSQ